MAKRESPIITKDGTDNDFSLKRGGDVWIKAGPFAIHIEDIREDKRVRLSVYTNGKETEDSINECEMNYGDAK